MSIVLLLFILSSILSLSTGLMGASVKVGQQMAAFIYKSGVQLKFNTVFRASLLTD